ncbi:MAG TPA: hypothetical protein DHW42_08360 [Candidatus Marinimicrobia bacterium]|nr:hypothetical protein [Candidatus Neomarinimicrobiota bacterium]
MDWTELFESEGLTSGRKLYSQYEFYIDKLKSPKIKVFVWEQINGLFFATTDYSIQNSEQAGPYREQNPHSSPEVALRSAIECITTWIKEPLDKIKFIKEDWE